MEGVGSRLGRASARYGPATVFSGPVRKWKKQWVHVSSSSSNASYQNTSQSNGNGNSNGSTLLLCRWTPISQTNNGNPDNNSGKPEPPRRKFRYTPIVVLEEQKKEAAKKVDHEAKTSKTEQVTASPASKSDDICEKTNIDNPLLEATQENKNQLAPQHSNSSHLDLGLCLKGPDDNHDSDGENKEAQLGRVSSAGFWALR